MLTFAPFRSPFNLHSEEIDHLSVDLCQQISKLKSLQQHFDISDVDWPNGYGSQEHDALPSFFRPLAQLKLKTATLDAINQDPSSTLHLDQLDILIYDDTIAIALGCWRGEALSTPIHEPEALDEKLTSRTNHVIEYLINESFQPCLEELNQTRHQAGFRKPKAFNIYRGITDDESSLPKSAMWVARTRVLDKQDSKSEWLEWAGGSDDTLQTLGDEAVFIGSGNSILIGTNTSDFCRAMCLCQYYASILSVYQAMLVEDLEKIQHVLHQDGIVKARNNLQKAIEHKLDHLDFVRLKHDQAIYGIQGQRRPLVNLIHEAWQTESQFDNVMGWANLLHERINRLYQNRQLRQNRFVQALLAFIGGLSLIDLVLTLNENKQAENIDGVPGLLDLISKIPVDAIIYIAIAVIVATVILVYRNEE